MADERDTRPADATPAARRRLRIRAELESRGVEPELSRRLAESLAPRIASLEPAAYAAALDGASAVCAAQREEREHVRHHAQEIEEIQRLMRGFAGELRKLEEGLRILSAYALRMRSRAVGDGSGTLH